MCVTGQDFNARSWAGVDLKSAPLGDPSSKAVEDEVQIVLAVLRGEFSIASDARWKGTSAMSLSKWRFGFQRGVRPLRRFQLGLPA